jgi:hypothetical protein
MVIDVIGMDNIPLNTKTAKSIALAAEAMPIKTNTRQNITGRII